EDADRIIQGKLKYYGRHWKDVGNPPNWFLNPFNQAMYPEADRHWTELPDFHPQVGDIKNVWEASRFEWLVTLARAYAVTGEAAYLSTLNSWLKDWVEKNPVNIGPNWKCGQEAAIRVFDLLLAALILQQWQAPSPALQEFIFRHLQRIKTNIRYALAQDNNHGTSEAAALFIAGNWLAETGFIKASGFARKGRAHLEERVVKLVEKDGSFSQHSVTYHRVMLDTLCFAEIWRKKMDQPFFSSDFYDKARAASDWLWMLSDEESGNAPNLGSNDGAMFLNSHGCDYRNFRPGIQLSQALFRNQAFFPDGPWDEPLYWFDINKEDLQIEPPLKQNKILDQSYAVMQSGNSWGMLRLPGYRFRPGHNDVLHFDLWFNGKNICRDGGSFTYNPGDAGLDKYFKSVLAHNTASFDKQEQMPRIGRFLMGRWIKPDFVSNIESNHDGTMSCRAAYTDHLGRTHQRCIEWKNDVWKVVDQFKGNYEMVQARYRLLPEQYSINGHILTASWGQMEVLTPDCEVRLEKGLESLYYWEKQDVELLVVTGGVECRRIVVRIDLENGGCER
ncbi:MAG: alginate lyase family protein, partial [Desulfonatronovibrionaceae bacterium]